eukprot:6202034-Pleurochrysis_carterae.AAC.3
MSAIADAVCRWTQRPGWKPFCWSRAAQSFAFAASSFSASRQPLLSLLHGSLFQSGDPRSNQSSDLFTAF